MCLLSTRLCSDTGPCAPQIPRCSGTPLPYAQCYVCSSSSLSASSIARPTINADGCTLGTRNRAERTGKRLWEPKLMPEPSPALAQTDSFKARRCCLPLSTLRHSGNSGEEHHCQGKGKGNERNSSF